MKQTLKWVVIFGVIGATGYLAYTKFFISKTQKVVKIIELGYSTGDFKTLMALDTTYIDAWYQAAKKGNASFVIGATTFNTQGGQVKK